MATKKKTTTNQEPEHDPELEAGPDLDTQPETADDVEAYRGIADELVDELLDADDPEDEHMRQPAMTLAEQIAQLVQTGLSDDEALMVIMKRRGEQPGSPGSVDAQRKLEEDYHEQARAEQQAAYQKRMANYVPPKLDETFEVTLPIRFADYVRRFAAWQAAARRREVSVEEAIGLIVRQHRLTNPDAGLMEHPNSPTGPASAFDARQGSWQA